MSIPTRVVSSLPTGTALSRYIIAKSLGAAQGLTVAEGWLDVPQVAHALRAELHTKASVDPMTTQDARAAAPLAQYGISREFLELLRGQSPCPSWVSAACSRFPLAPNFRESSTRGLAPRGSAKVRRYPL